MDFGIKGRVALVSGSGGGLGRAMAIASSTLFWMSRAMRSGATATTAYAR